MNESVQGRTEVNKRERKNSTEGCFRGIGDGPLQMRLNSFASKDKAQDLTLKGNIQLRRYNYRQ